MPQCLRIVTSLLFLCLLTASGCGREGNDAPAADEPIKQHADGTDSGAERQRTDRKDTPRKEAPEDPKSSKAPGEKEQPAVAEPVPDDANRETTADSEEAGVKEEDADTEEAEDEQTAEEDEARDKFAGHVAGLEDPRPEAAWAPDTTGEYPIGAFNNYIEKGDLDAIKKRGKLRILVDIANTDSLHRAATLQDIQIERAKRKAKYLGLEPVVLYVDKYEQLIPLLIEGKGDIIANHMVITESRLKQIDFSIPVGKTRYLLLSRKETPDVKEGESMKGKTVYVTKGTHMEEIAKQRAPDFPGVKIKAVDTNYITLAEEVSRGKIDFTIIPDTAFDLISQYRDNLKDNFTGDVERPTAWGIRRNSPQLKEELDRAVRHFELTKLDDRFLGDLDGIKERGVLRAVSRNHPGTYFMWKGRVMGYEYEMLQKFAKKLDVRLEVIVAPTHKELFSMVRDGKADVAAKLLSATRARDEAGLDFGPTYMKESVSIVGRPDDKIESLKDLRGRTLHLLRSSSQFELVMELLKEHPEYGNLGVDIELVPEELTIPQILDRVADGEYDLTIADDATVRLEHHWRDDIVNLYDLQIEDNNYAWMVREQSPQLLEAITEFFNDPKIAKLRDTLYHKYFDEPKRTRDEIKSLSEKGQISPYDHLVKKYAEQYDFDWRLIVAQMFQESTFNPKAKSWVGARGLMQVMPDTGKQVGEHKNLFDPETSVRAGMKYLEWLHRKFEDKGISPENMMWFTLASYNAGLGHVYDAQDLAEEKGWDRKVWFDNVEKAMLLLSEKKYYSKARYGYARGREPYDYVRKISQRFRTYAALLEAYQRQQEVGRITCSSLPPWLAANLAGCQQLSAQALARH
ncbi:transporter substrate-binding domain-containing protein [Microbulbifer guangxiensis]|uniref:transporter substrate-binding domain-containing protein n=1 Tax=Microbulbifer guangxiensis TaxID=2904249 RepID=UPI001F30E8A0|nr:transporter substrate-binding domain-containing protein [Microbulbifer guangxiensis]